MSRVASSILAGALFATAAAAQTAGDIQTQSGVDATKAGATPSLSIFNNPSFLVVPIPVINPAIGAGGTLVAAMLFKTDEASQSSMIGGAGFYTSNGSWGAGLVTSLAFDEDRYHVKASGGYASVTYEFFGIGNAAGASDLHVALTQSGYMVKGSAQRRVAADLYLGAQFRYLDIGTMFSPPELLAGLPGANGLLSNLNSTVLTFGVVGAFDTRNMDYTPTGGELIEGEFNFNRYRSFGSRNYLRMSIGYNRYDRLSDDLVLASRASLCAIDGQAPIFDLCLFGSNNDLRGYAVGRFQDKAMFAAQTELRWRAFGRFGFVAFGGIGSVAPSVGEFKNILAAGGAGLRFMASEEYGVNVGIDGAVNKDGEKTIYFHVAEAF